MRKDLLLKRIEQYEEGDCESHYSLFFVFSPLQNSPKSNTDIFKPLSPISLKLTISPQHINSLLFLLYSMEKDTMFLNKLNKLG